MFTGCNVKQYEWAFSFIHDNNQLCTLATSKNNGLSCYHRMPYLKGILLLHY